jgi:hypothetical protein
VDLHLDFDWFFTSGLNVDVRTSVGFAAACFAKFRPHSCSPCYLTWWASMAMEAGSKYSIFLASPRSAAASHLPLGLRWISRSGAAALVLVPPALTARVLVAFS